MDGLTYYECCRHCGDDCGAQDRHRFPCNGLHQGSFSMPTESEGAAMSKYKAGQRVRAEWDGGAIEGTLQGNVLGGLNLPVPTTGAYISELQIIMPGGRPGAGVTVTILSEPRPDEPKGLGAVVEAGEQRRLNVRVQENRWRDTGLNLRDWKDLPDPVVILSEGWTADE